MESQSVGQSALGALACPSWLVTVSHCDPQRRACIAGAPTVRWAGCRLSWKRLSRRRR